MLGTVLTVGGTIGATLGLATTFVGEIVGLSTINGGNGDPTIAFVAAAAGVGVAALGTAGIIGGANLDGEADAERMTAFLCYERDLRKRLALKRPDEAVPLERKWAIESPPPASTTAPSSTAPTPASHATPDPAEP
jgi:hypothetical protein